MQTFLNDDFLLESATARRLYHEVAAGLPIIDYHCHLPPEDIANNRQFANLTEIWLEGDHYKWRAMRANGIAEEFCTGHADPYEKFLAWARTVLMTLRNPLYHWTHLELSRYFGIAALLNEKSAPAIWEEANAKLAESSYRVHGLFQKMKVEIVCTTDDPCDSLEPHRTAQRSDLTTRVFPAFRPDKAMQFADLTVWNQWRERLEKAADCDTQTFSGFLAALENRHAFFHKTGCRLSDHGLAQCPATFADDVELEKSHTKAIAGDTLSAYEADALATSILLEVGRANARRGWTFQLHLGALRSVNTRQLASLGRDTGFDSIGDLPQGDRLGRFLDALECDDSLPRTILYNLNPADNYLFATMAGNFNDGVIPGKIQFGSGWWFLDQKEGMEWQLNALSNLGLLSRFVGMITDSRSFMSYPRHEYFRRVLCQMLGSEADRGLLPDDFDLLSTYVQAICHDNAEAYFRFPKL